MRKASITISFDEEKLSALKMYLEQKNMNVEEQIILILNKIKQMYKYDNNIKSLLDLNPKINVVLVDNKLFLQELIYDYNDKNVPINIQLVTLNTIIEDINRNHNLISQEYEYGYDLIDTESRSVIKIIFDNNEFEKGLYLFGEKL